MFYFLTSAFLFFLFSPSPRTASAASLLAPSLNWMDVRFVSSITINAKAIYATDAGSPSPAAVSVPWATSSILSTSYVLSAWHSCQRESSGNRMTRPIVNPASISSSYSNLSWTYSLFRSPINFKPREERVHLLLLIFLLLNRLIEKVKLKNK